MNVLFSELQSIIFFLTLFFFWDAAYQTNTFIGSYTKNEMMTYFLGIAILSAFVFNSRNSDIAGDIVSGRLSKDLLYPWNIFLYWVVRDVFDKGVKMILLVPKVILYVMLFHIEPVIPTGGVVFQVICISFIGVVLYYFINIFLSFLAFWTDDIWAIRWLFGIILLELFSGVFFPIDIMPNLLQKIFFLTPFPYLQYIPMKIWLGDMSMQGIIYSSLILCVWTLFFAFISLRLWSKGVRQYGAYGG